MAVLGIVAGITDAGLTAVGSREISVARTRGRARPTSSTTCSCSASSVPASACLGAVVFTVVAGYDGAVIAGTAIGGVGVVLISAQSMLTVPIWVGLRIVSLTALEVLRNLLTLAGVAVLVLAGAGLLPFFGVQVAVAVVLIPVTLLLARVGLRFASGVRARGDRAAAARDASARRRLCDERVYFRVLVVLVSLLSTEDETGLFGTSFRIFEMLLGLPALILSVALPLLSVAGDEDDVAPAARAPEHDGGVAADRNAARRRDRHPGRAAGSGSSAARSTSAPRPVLRIQALALIPLFLVQTWQLGLIAGRAQRAMAVANGLALVLVLALGLAFVPARRRRGCGLGRRRRRDRARRVPLDRARPDAARRSAEPAVLLEGRCWRRGLPAAPGICCATRPSSLRVVAAVVFVAVADRDAGRARRPVPRARLQVGRGRRRASDRAAARRRPARAPREHRRAASLGAPARPLRDRSRDDGPRRPGDRRPRRAVDDRTDEKGTAPARAVRHSGDAADRRCVPRHRRARARAPRSSTPPSSARGSPLSRRACASEHGFRLVATVWETIPFRSTFRTARAAANRRVVLAETDLFLPTTERARRCLLLEGAADRADPGRRAGDRRRALCGRLRAAPRRPRDRLAGRLVWEKGHYDVIRALATVGGERPSPDRRSRPRARPAAALCRRPRGRRPGRDPARPLRRDAVRLRRVPRASFSPACRSRPGRSSSAWCWPRPLPPERRCSRAPRARSPRFSTDPARRSSHPVTGSGSRGLLEAGPLAAASGRARRLSGRGRPAVLDAVRPPRGSRLLTSASWRANGGRGGRRSPVARRPLARGSARLSGSGPFARATRTM